MLTTLHSQKEIVKINQSRLFHKSQEDSLHSGTPQKINKDRYKKAWNQNLNQAKFQQIFSQIQVHAQEKMIEGHKKWQGSSKSNLQKNNMVLQFIQAAPSRNFQLQFDGTYDNLVRQALHSAKSSPEKFTEQPLIRKKAKIYEQCVLPSKHQGFYVLSPFKQEQTQLQSQNNKNISSQNYHLKLTMNSDDNKITNVLQKKQNRVRSNTQIVTGGTPKKLGTPRLTQDKGASTFKRYQGQDLFKSINTMEEESIQVRKGSFESTQIWKSQAQAGLGRQEDLKDQYEQLDARLQRMRLKAREDKLNSKEGARWMNVSNNISQCEMSLQEEQKTDISSHCEMNTGKRMVKRRYTKL